MAFGLRPCQHDGSSGYNAKIKKMYVPSAEGSAMYIGQAVVKVGDANDAVVSTAQSEYAPGFLSEVDTIDLIDNAVPSGVIVGIEMAPHAVSGAAYKPASTEAVLAVCVDPNALFEVEADGPMTVDSVGLNAVLINSLTGSSATGMSAGQLDTTSDAPAADASNPLLIVGLAPIPGNAWDNANPIVLVRLNAHTEVVGSLGIA